MGEVVTRKRMFRKGRKLHSMEQVARAVEGNLYIFMFDRPQHPGWVRSMRLGTVLAFLRRGYLREALRTGA